MAELDKYEYKLKVDQMKSLAAEGKYEEAVEIVDSITFVLLLLSLSLS